MKVLITGGHFSPAYSVIQELLKNGDEVVIIGRVHPFEGDKKAFSYEYRVSKELNIPFVELSTGRLQRRISLYSLPSLIRLGKGLIQSKKLIKDISPDIVLTFGGYLALPVAIAAYFHKIPVVTHEQTQGLGLSNKLIAKISNTVCVSFPSTKKMLNHSNVVLTGNPIRKEIFEVDEKIDFPKNLPVIYITGGSTGSHIINKTILECVEELVEKYVVIHQTGENKFNDFEKASEKQKNLPADVQDRYVVRKYIYPSQIGYIYKMCDLVIGRSGANTVLELIAKNKPSLLIPLSHGQKGEQMKNALLISSLGLGIIIQQEDLTREVLSSTITDMVDSLAEYSIEKDIIDQYIFTDAAQRIVQELTALYEKKEYQAK